MPSNAVPLSRLTVAWLAGVLLLASPPTLDWLVRWVVGRWVL